MLKFFASKSQMSLTDGEILDHEGNIFEAIPYYEKYLSLCRANRKEFSGPTGFAAAIRLFEIYQDQNHLNLVHWG
jgi:hypothetical protein